MTELRVEERGVIMRMKRLFAWAITTLFLVSALNVFSISSTAQGNEDTVYIAMQQDMPNFNVFDLASNTVWKDYVLGKFVFESLSGLDPGGNIYPKLAETWLFWESNLTVVVLLRQGVKFQDLAEMTADDVVFSYFSLRDGTTY